MSRRGHLDGLRGIHFTNIYTVPLVIGLQLIFPNIYFKFDELETTQITSKINLITELVEFIKRVKLFQRSFL
jgi:hypothetical protein